MPWSEAIQVKHGVLKNIFRENLEIFWLQPFPLPRFSANLRETTLQRKILATGLGMQNVLCLVYIHLRKKISDKGKKANGNK